MGGYFVVNGNEKVIRMLIMPRRNFVSIICAFCTFKVDLLFEFYMNYFFIDFLIFSHLL